jgi:4-amino-4-deoxy-L-arabinose transferase-like glycosyltransferase
VTTPRPPRLLLLPCSLVFVAALAIRLIYALTRPVPLSADAAYYVAVAENLYHGRGFVADYVWNYMGGIPSSLPAPSNGYWMPGQSVVMAGAFALARAASLRAAQAPSILFGAFLCAITAWTGGLISHRRDVAVLSGAMAAVNFHLVGLTLYPDHVMLAAVLVNLSLLTLCAAWRGRTALALAAGALVALAYLTRTDGALIVIVARLLAIGLLRRRERTRGLRLALYFLVAFAVIAAPWWARQTLVFGHPSGANPLRTAFLTEYSDLFRVDLSHLGLADYLRAGQLAVWTTKLDTLLQELHLLRKAVEIIGLLAIAALFLRPARRESLPWLIYLLVAVAVPALIVPLPAAKGGFWHLMPSLLPAIFVLASVALMHLYDVGKAKGAVPIRGAAVVLFSLAFGSLVYVWAVAPKHPTGKGESLYPAVAAQAVRALDPKPTAVLTDSAWGLYHVARMPCAQFPSDGAEAALLVADTLGADYFVTRADAPDKIPTIAEVMNHPRFQPLARYPAGETRLLVYRILPPSTQPLPR